MKWLKNKESRLKKKYYKERVYSWEDISIEQALDIESIRQMKWFGDYRDINRLIDIACTVTGESFEYFDNMSVEEWGQVQDNVIGFVFTPFTIDSRNDGKFWQTPSYILNGTKYLVTPFTESSNDTIKQSKKKTARFIDYTTLIKVDSKNYPAILSTILIPVGKEYGDYDLEAVKSDIANYMSISQALGLYSFFIKTSAISKKLTLLYSVILAKTRLKRLIRKGKNQDETMKKKLEETLEKYGAISLTELSNLNV